MKRTLVLLALICLANGCAWLGGHNPNRTDYSGAATVERGTTDVSTGADADSLGIITGSSTAPR